MKRINSLRLASAGFLSVALFIPVAALAQYVWLDEKGVKQYSDMPPPPSVPTARILKQPGERARPAPDSTALDSNATAPKSLAEQNAEFKKRRMEQAEKEKKAAEEARLAAEKSKHCERTRSYLRALESGERIAQTDSSGDRTFLSDEQRERELREARKLAQDCK